VTVAKSLVIARRTRSISRRRWRFGADRNSSTRAVFNQTGIAEFPDPHPLRTHQCRRDDSGVDIDARHHLRVRTSSPNSRRPA